MKAILFDLDGVFYQGDQLIQGSPGVIKWAEQESIPYLFVTNTSSRPRTELVKKLASFGLQVEAEKIFTPAVAAVSYLHKMNIHRQVALYIPEATKSEFSEFELWQESPSILEAIIIGDLGQGWNYSLLNQIFQQLMQNPNSVFIALGMTRYWQAEDGLRLDVAPFIKALEFATDRQAIVMGKPAAHFFDSAISKLGMQADDVLMIGDDIRGDIEGAQKSGLHAWLVKTGKYRDRDLETDIKPEKVIDTIVDLKEYWS